MCIFLHIPLSSIYTSNLNVLKSTGFNVSLSLSSYTQCHFRLAYHWLLLYSSDSSTSAVTTCPTDLQGSYDMYMPLCSGSTVYGASQSSSLSFNYSSCASSSVFSSKYTFISPQTTNQLLFYTFPLSKRDVNTCFNKWAFKTCVSLMA